MFCIVLKSNLILRTVYFAISQAFLFSHYVLLYLYTYKVAFPEDRTFCSKHESRSESLVRDNWSTTLT